VVASIGANGQLVLIGLSGSLGVASITGSGGGGGVAALPSPITLNRALSSGNQGGYNTTSWQNASANYNITLFGYYSVIGLNYKTIMQNMQNYSASNLTAGHVCITGHEQGDEQFWKSGYSGATDPVKVAALNNTGSSSTLGWGLQASGYPSGTLAEGVSGSNTVSSNNATSPQCPQHSLGTLGSISVPSNLNWAQWTAWYEYQVLTQGNLHALGDPSSIPANSLVGAIDHDNQFMIPRISGCWESTSTVYSSSSQYQTIAPYLQRGYRDAAVMWRSLQPGILIIGNCDYYSYYNSSANPQVLDPSNTGLWDVAYCEAPVGQSFSKATDTTWGVFVACLLSQEALVSSTGKCCWLAEGSGGGVLNDYTGPQSGWNAAQWRAARYQWGMAQLLRWICGVQNDASVPYLFDEWNAGANKLGYLGSPAGSRGLSVSGGSATWTPPAGNTAAANAWAQGIITVSFENGCNCYLYPAGTNDAISGSTVTLASTALQGGGGHHITYTLTPSGSIPPGASSGASFSSLQIQPRDCVFTLP
jgi:hypothetical protein